MKRVLLLLIWVVRLCFSVLLLVTFLSPATADDFHGQALPVSDVPPRASLGTVRQIVPGAQEQQRLVTVEVTGGYGAGQAITVIQHIGGPHGHELMVHPGDRVVLSATPLEDDELDWQIVDHQRAEPIWLLMGFTALAFALVGGWRGLKTLMILALTLGTVAGILLPLTLRGWSPLPLAVVLAGFIALATALLTSGAGRKTWTAVGGTTVSVFLAAMLSAVFVVWAKLSGAASEGSVMLLGSLGVSIDAPGLLAASMLIGLLGVLLDLSLSIASAVDELSGANPGMARATLFQAGCQVGRDLLSTTSNTLMLAYLGGFLPVMLSLSVQPLSGLRVMHLETVGTFAVTLLVGLASLLFTIPLTAWLSAIAQPRTPRLQKNDTET